MIHIIKLNTSNLVYFNGIKYNYDNNIHTYLFKNICKQFYVLDYSKNNNKKDDLIMNILNTFIPNLRDNQLPSFCFEKDNSKWIKKIMKNSPKNKNKRKREKEFINNSTNKKKRKINYLH